MHVPTPSLKLVLSSLSTIFFIGCSQVSKDSSAEDASGSLDAYEISSMGIQLDDRGLLMKNDSESLLSANSLQLKSNTEDSQYLWRIDKDFQVVPVEVELKDKSNSEHLKKVFMQIRYMKQISKDVIGFELTNNDLLIYEISKKRTLRYPGYSLRETSVYGNWLYTIYPSQGLLVKLDLSLEKPELIPINNPLGVSLNTGISTFILSAGPGDDFLRVATITANYRNYFASRNIASPSYVVTKDGVIAFSGSYSPWDIRATIFTEDGAYDTFMYEFWNVGGGFHGGYISYAEDLYQIEVVNSQGCLILGPGRAIGCGDYLKRLDIPNWIQAAKTGNWINLKTTIVNVSSESKMQDLKNRLIFFTTEDKLMDTSRYILSEKGFLHTYLDSNSNLTMEWVDLDLSVVPRDSSYLTNTVQVHGEYVFWLNTNNEIYYQELKAGSSAKLFTSSASPVLNFYVVSDSVIYDTDEGSFLVKSPGASPKKIHEHPGKVSFPVGLSQ